MIYVTCFFVSALGGLLVGGIGTGSSLLVLPALVLIFEQLLPNLDGVRFAAGTTMATIAVGAIAGGISRYRAGQVDTSLVRLLILPYTLGAFAGPWVASVLSVPALKTYIACLAILIAASLVFRSRPSVERRLKIDGRKIEIVGVLTSIALLSSMGGIASGVFAIPYLMRFALPMQTIIATSTVGAGIFASFGTVGYISAGINNTPVIENTLGYVYLPIFALMAVTAAVFTPLGVKLSGRLDERLIKKILAIFLFASALAILRDGLFR